MAIKWAKYYKFKIGPLNFISNTITQAKLKFIAELDYTFKLSSFSSQTSSSLFTRYLIKLFFTNQDYKINDFLFMNLQKLNSLILFEIILFE